MLQFTFFLLVGILLFAYYNTAAVGQKFASFDEIFPTFIVQHMPHGVSGLLIAAILAAAMSNLSAALNSLSSSSIVDFYVRRHPETSEARRMKLSRVSTLFWALVLFTLAIMSRNIKVVVEVGLAIAGVAYGALLGVFLLGVLTKSTHERGAMVGMFVGFMLNLYIWQFTKLPFTWYVMIGSCVTFVVGMLASVAIKKDPKETARAHA
jgi:Na+/proline symporter